MFFVGDCVQLFAVQPVHVADVAQPRVQRAVVAGLHGGFDAAAVVVSADDDVFDFQMIDRVADYAGSIDVQRLTILACCGGRIPRPASCPSFFGSNAAVGTADVEVVRRLICGERLEKMRVVP